MATLYVASGGGGDALAAAIIHRALGGHEPAVIATYAWDRLAVDPLPGPRSASDFLGLEPLGQLNYAITPAATPKPPSGSTLPRLAAEIADTLALLDPAGGAVGMRSQLEELVALYNADEVTLVDVGGDALAKGDEPGLRSPLADALALAACTRLPVRSRLLVAGPGLDGELSEDDVLAITGPAPVLHLDEDNVAPFKATLDWHPSEATALFVAAARGLRGHVEIRDSGLPVKLTDHSRDVYAMALDDAIASNTLASALAHSSNLEASEEAARKVCGFSEIDYERAKATRRQRTPVADAADVDEIIRLFEKDAANRGVDYVTFRRLAEATLLTPAQAADLRSHLVGSRPERYEWPLWALETGDSVS